MSEFVIVGGGVYGAAVAWELARRGAGVQLLEGRSIASAASGGPGRRGTRANMRDRRELPLMAEAYLRWPGLHEELDCPPTYTRTGHLELIERTQDLDAAPARVWMQQRAGIDTRLVEGEALREREPELAETVAAAIFCPGDGVTDHAATTWYFARAAERAGAEIVEHRTVASLEMSGNTVRALRLADGERVRVPGRCLLLANAGVAGLLHDACGLELPVWNQALQVLLARPAEPVGIRHLIGHASRTVAIKSEPDDLVMVSGGYRGRWHRETWQGEALPEAVSANLEQAAAVFPRLRDAAVVDAHVGHLESMCVDEVPIIDRLSPDSNLYYATGWCGHGWAIAPAVSRLLAEWVLESRRPPLLAPFALERFG